MRWTGCWPGYDLSMTHCEATRRVFFALWPSPEIRAEIVRRRQAIDGLSRRRVPDHNLHLTLLFLGDQPSERIPEIITAAENPELSGFEMVLDQLGWFARARVAWLGGHAPARGKALVTALTARADELGLAFDRRPWAPHVTLFRKVAARPNLPEIEPLVWPVQQFALIESVPGRPYEALAQFDLN